MDKQWLRKMFEEAGLEPDQAQKAAEETTLRLLKRERPTRVFESKRRSILDNLVRDPLVSLNRIIGRQYGGLPFVGESMDRLSAAAFSDAFTEAGIDPVVSMAFAKVVEEAFTPKEFYQPIWEALGHTGEVDLEALRREDWSPLRAVFPEVAARSLEDGATEQVRVVKPRAKPPAKPGSRIIRGTVKKKP